ncbi:uncharacterized protein LOC130443249 [Diorhabda sublineata]|uniref:uncharacterized protein LOC130443249 n=1 Tax=Diorhabda sublineata TaxID=1163346 RepID=UPI0024E095B4|nr:uncharacterized protein LOC130443249 [Diorhabda sublineata]
MDLIDGDDVCKKQVLAEKAKRRMELREYFLMQKSYPFKHMAGEGGTVFDPAIIRYHSMIMYERDWFRPSFSNSLKGICFLVLPMSLLYYAIRKTKLYEERKIRRGEVAYKDRRFKFI